MNSFSTQRKAGILVGTFAIITIAIIALMISTSSPQQTTINYPKPPFSSDMKVVAISFDDCYKSQLEAIPVLDQYGFKATFGIVTSYTSYKAYMKWQDIQNLALQGHDIESHTCTHAHLETVSYETLIFELQESKKELLDHGINASILIYPFGEGYNNSTVLSAVSKFYQYARSTQTHSLNITSNFEPLAVPAFNIMNNVTMPIFSDILNGTKGNSVGVIYYHKIGYDNDYTSVTPENFKAQMQYLHDNNFTVIPMKQLLSSFSLAV
jgi:hypothetical protein